MIGKFFGSQILPVCKINMRLFENIIYTYLFKSFWFDLKQDLSLAFPSSKNGTSEENGCEDFYSILPVVYFTAASPCMKNEKQMFSGNSTSKQVLMSSLIE